MQAARNWVALVLALALFGQRTLAQVEDSCQGYSLPGPYQWGSTVINIAVDELNFETYFYYPALYQGKNTPYDGSGAPYPVLTFAHGLVCPLFEYYSYFEHFASRGYFMLGPVVDYELLQNNKTMTKFVLAMRAILDYMEQENNDASSWLYNQVVYNKTGITGHSLGGYIAAEAVGYPFYDPRIKAAAPMAGGSVPPSQMKDVEAALLILSGTADFVSTPAENQILYNEWNVPRLWPLMTGGWHCGFMDVNVQVPDWACREPLQFNLPRAVQEMLTRCLMTPFFDLYLKGYETAIDFVWGVTANSYEYVNMTSDPGMTMEPRAQNATLQGSGTVAFYTTLTNTRAQASTYNVYVGSATCQTAVLTPIVTLQPNEASKIVVSLIIPQQSESNVNSATVFARWSGDNVTAQYVTLTVYSE